MLDFADRTGSSIFMEVWPQMEVTGRTQTYTRSSSPTTDTMVRKEHHQLVPGAASVYSITDPESWPLSHAATWRKPKKILPLAVLGQSNT